MPDPKVDDGYGSSDGSMTNDGQILIDGAFADAFVPPRDGSVTNPDGGPPPPPVDSGHDFCNGIDCLGGDCVNDQCQAFPIYTKAELAASSIASDGANVFFISGTGDIDRVNVSTLAFDQLVSSEDGLQKISVAGSAFYFSRQATSAGGISSCPTTGSAGACGSGTGRINYFAGSSNLFFDVAVNATTLYFTYDQASTPKGVYSCALGVGGCSGTLLVGTGSAHDLAELGTELFWDDSTVSQNGVYQVSTTTSTQVSANQTDIVDVAVNSTQLVYATTSGVSYRTPSETLGHQIVNISGAMNIAVGADDTYVYWIDSAHGGLFQRCPLSGDCTAATPVETLASSLDDPKDFVLSGNSAYITTLNSIMRVVVNNK